MGLEIYFPEDIRNALLAANEASAATVGVMATVTHHCPHAMPAAATITCSMCGEKVYYADKVSILRAYLEGYRAALTTVALAFGLSPFIFGKPSVQTDAIQEWQVVEDISKTS